MTWKRIATFVAGGAAVVVGIVIPAAGTALIPAGTALIGFATKWPGDKTPKQVAKEADEEG